MGYMRHGRKKYPKFTTKIPIFIYSTRVNLDLTSNHSKSCRGLIIVHSVQFWGQTDLIWQCWNFKMVIFTKKVYYRPFESFKNRSNHPIWLKIYQHTQIEKGFQNCFETWESEKVIFWPARFLATISLKSFENQNLITWFWESNRYK
jgi:hypothetical protein